LLAAARGDLESSGLRASEAAAFVSSAAGLQLDSDFWAHMERGLAAFIGGGGMWTYRLPVPVEELVVVADGFHVKPLLSSVASGEVFYVLALSQHEVRLLRGSRFDVSELALGTIPESLAEALRYDDRESQLQSHSANRAGPGRVVAAFHGQGVGKDTKDADLSRFLAAVDEGIGEIIGTSSAPLVLAGVTDVVARFRKLSNYSHIADGGIRGNPERLSPAELHREAWPLVEPLYKADQDKSRAAIESQAMPSVGSPGDAVVAAIGGRIESLFVPSGVQQWGTLEAGGQSVDEHDTQHLGDRDLFDLAAVETLAHGGRVFVVSEAEIPGEGPVAAALRN
jgi:hypothetical protein